MHIRFNFTLQVYQRIVSETMVNGGVEKRGREDRNSLDEFYDNYDAVGD